MKKLILGEKWYERLTKFCAAILFSAGAFLIGLAGVLGMPEATLAAELTQDAIAGIMNAGKLSPGMTTGTMNAGKLSPETGSAPTGGKGAVRAAEPATAWDAGNVPGGEKEDIQITEFGVVQDEEGIYAKCVYREFDRSGGMIQLYLERSQGQGEFLPVSYADLDMAGGETKAIRTAPADPVPGIYRAVLVRRGGGGTPVVRFQNSSPYEVKDVGKGNEGNVGESREPAEILYAMRNRENTGRNEACRHVPVEKTLREADPDHDEILAKYCERCGKLLDCFEVPNSAYAAFLNEAEQKISNALPEELVIIETDRWVSFDERVLKAIGDRKDLPILVRFQYEGEQQQTFIPPGTDITGLADENGFCGFCRLTDFLHR